MAEEYGYIKYRPAIYRDGAFRKLKPYIIKITNLGPVPDQGLIDNTNEVYLTNEKDYFITSNSITLTDTIGNTILYEKVPYNSYIWGKITTPNNAFTTIDSSIYATVNGEIFVTAG